MLPGSFQRDPAFDLATLATLAARAFGSFHSDAEYGPVVWRFAPSAANAARDFTFHPDQQVEHYWGATDPAAGHFDGPDFQHFRLCPGFESPDQILILINADKHFVPLSGFGWPVFLGKHLAAVLRAWPSALIPSAGQLEPVALNGSICRGGNQSNTMSVSQAWIGFVGQIIARTVFRPSARGERRLTPALARRRGQPLRLRLEPDRQRSTPRQRRVVVMPGRGGGGGCGWFSKPS